jgi:predicted metal-binding membrane protein
LLVALGDTAVDEVQPRSLQRNVILGLLLALATAAWAVLVWQHHDVSVDMTMASPTAWALHAQLFLAIWVIMMLAMMLPTALPMVLSFHEAQAKDHEHQLDVAFVSTWVFVAAYLLMWALSGIAAYAGVLAAAAVRPALADEVGGLILIVAGHGVYCLGCCWLLLVILFPLGMTTGTMAAVTLIILAEKTLPRPEFASYGAAVVLVLYGGLMVVTPGLPAVFGFFGRLSEDVWLRLGLVVWIMVLFIAANAARPKH